MKYIDPEEIDRLPGSRIRPGNTFSFRCGPELACFNRCCRNLNLFLYPYDALRLYRHLGIGSNEFIDTYVDMVLRPGHFFPEVLLRMADNPERTCPFLTDSGCGVYPHRPDTCRSFPVEQGALYDAARKRTEPLYLFRPPDFCLGQNETQQWTIETWLSDQEARTYQEMTLLWADVRRLFQSDPWGAEGFAGAKGRMAFMATYNLDRFRGFIFESTFLKRYRVKSDLVAKLRNDDTALLKFGFEWIRLFVWGLSSKVIRPR